MISNCILYESPWSCTVKENALCLTSPLPQNFVFQGYIMSDILISSGDVASFPLKIYCFSRGNTRYAFVSSIQHTWNNFICLLCPLILVSWYRCCQKRWVITNFMEIQMKASFHRLLLKKEGIRATWEYPFAVAGINISYMLIQMLDLYSGLCTISQC